MSISTHHVLLSNDLAMDLKATAQDMQGLIDGRQLPRVLWRDLRTVDHLNINMRTHHTVVALLSATVSAFGQVLCWFSVIFSL